MWEKIVYNYLDNYLKISFSILYFSQDCVKAWSATFCNNTNLLEPNLAINIKIDNLLVLHDHVTVLCLIRVACLS